MLEYPWVLGKCIRNQENRIPVKSEKDTKNQTPNLLPTALDNRCCTVKNSLHLWRAWNSSLELPMTLYQLVTIFLTCLLSTAPHEAKNQRAEPCTTYLSCM
ncbi:hypothetical protein O6H91_11G006400 [Diphasiastrum complanatum]|uniref:Uncharacterized protein n=1 Tax=Diphasiastrum complanatum TaxID=34168 RepID=A0ACC2C632_DIPCM|nr:hypothetical protein O6H91_11G006400 [Diphasiastrum complanatum]